MFGKKESIPTEKKTLYKVHLYIGPDDTLDFITDVKPKMRFEEGVSIIVTSNRYRWNYDDGCGSAHGKITYDSFDVAYYEEFEADVKKEC